MAEYIRGCPLSGHHTSVRVFNGVGNVKTWRYECSSRNASGGSACTYVSATFPGEGPVPIGEHPDGLALLESLGLLP